MFPQTFSYSILWTTCPSYALRCVYIDRLVRITEPGPVREVQQNM
jgi:hypothetical protein